MSETTNKWTKANRYEVRDENGQTVCHTDHEPHTDLIAAAPKMAEALERLINAADAIGEQHNDGSADWAITMARSALSAARGEVQK